MLPASESALGPCERSGETFTASHVDLRDLDRFHTSSHLGSPCLLREFIVPVDIICKYNSVCVLKLLLCFFFLFYYSFAAIGRARSWWLPVIWWLPVGSNHSLSSNSKRAECEGVRGIFCCQRAFWLRCLGAEWVMEKKGRWSYCIGFLVPDVINCFALWYFDYLNGCQEKGSVWVALQTCDARAGFFFPSSDNR